METGHSKAVESIMRSFPELVKSQIVQQITVRTAVEKFYTKNEDLVPYKKTVAAIANQVASKYPDQPLDKIFELTGKVARKHLKLKDKAMERDNGKGGDGKFPKKPSGPRAKGSEKAPEGMVKEIGDMLDAL